MKKVLDECYKTYLEKQCVKFLVHCSYKAWIKLIDLNFYVHNPSWPYFKNHPDWAEDVPPEPSCPDTWAAYNVPFSEQKSESFITSTLSETTSTDMNINICPHSSESVINNYFNRDYFKDFTHFGEEEGEGYYSSERKSTFVRF